MGFAFQVTSSSHPLDTVLKAVLEFVAGVPSLILKMVSTEYNSIVRSLSNSKLEPPKNLGESASLAWAQIDERRLNFTARADQAKILIENILVSQEIMTEFAGSLFAGPKCRMMVVQASASGNVVPVPGVEQDKCIILVKPIDLHNHILTSFYPTKV